MKNLIRVTILLLSAVMLFAGCSSESKGSDMTLDKFVKAYTDAGVKEAQDKKQPMFAMVGAEDGLIFDMDNKKVAIYQYPSEKALKEVKSKNEIAKDWPANGRFLLETNYAKAKEIFESVK
ncbi:hypothetical protein [Paenibacillus chitinolyticus]